MKIEICPACQLEKLGAEYPVPVPHRCSPSSNVDHQRSEWLRKHFADQQSEAIRAKNRHKRST